jgi:hypothetical protein
MTRGRLLGRDPSGTRSVLAWTVSGAWTAQCRCLPLTVSKLSSDIVASPGTMLAPALSTDREQQKQHILTPVSAKATRTPAQRHAHHSSICGAARHTQACLHTRTHVHARTRMRTQIRTQTRAQIHMHAYKHTDTRASTHTHAQTQAHTHAHIHTHTCMCAHTLARTHAYARTRCVCDGLRQFLSVASDAPTLV